MEFEGCFGDKRLAQRGRKVVNSLFSKSVHSIRQISNDYASQRGWYRFLRNDKTTEEEIIGQMANQCSESVVGRTVLCIQDTTDINLFGHRNRIKSDPDLGRTNSPDHGLGFFIHPCLVLDAKVGFPIGYSSVKLWNRPMEKSKKADRAKVSKRLPIEEKESYKWIESSLKTKESMSQAESVIIVQDREGDIFEQFALVPDERTHLLVRSRFNRSLKEGVKLQTKLDQAEIAGTYSIDLPGDKRKNRIKRTVELEVRFCQVTLKRPVKADKNIKESVELYAVEARERSSKKGKPITWRLLTSIPVTNLDEALCIIQWYSWRWMIEEVFRILKQGGYDIEASELESGKAIRKLSLLMMMSINKLFQMRYSYNIPEGETLESIMCFNPKEQQCLELQCKRLEGKTEKLKNPHPKSSLRWATWVIARLGGWKGYKSERQPGITTLWIGLNRFYDIYQGWRLYEDVYTP